MNCIIVDDDQMSRTALKHLIEKVDFLNLKEECSDAVEAFNYLKKEDAEINIKSQPDEEFYFNDNGLIIMTSEYLLQRGYCCGNGCKHCPYDYKNVTEPKRTNLLLQRDE